MVLEFSSPSPLAHEQVHRVERVVESTSKYDEVAFAWETGAHYLQKQLDPTKGGPCSGPRTPGNNVNPALHCDPSRLPV